MRARPFPSRRDLSRWLHSRRCGARRTVVHAGMARAQTGQRTVEYQRDHELELHLLHVQPRLSRHVSYFLSSHDRQAWHHEQAEAAMASASAMLNAAGVPHHRR